LKRIVRQYASQHLGISDPHTPLTKIIGNAAAELLASASPDVTPRELERSVAQQRRQAALAAYDRLRPEKGRATARIVAK
jgi:hypothetical protein